SEHMSEGLKIVPITVHLPFQVIFPVVLLLIAFLKRRIKGKKK
ncbi:spore gernimation protein KB, partial [Bacillus atrophaeus]